MENLQAAGGAQALEILPAQLLGEKVRLRSRNDHYLFTENWKKCENCQ